MIADWKMAIQNGVHIRCPITKWCPIIDANPYSKQDDQPNISIVR